MLSSDDVSQKVFGSTMMRAGYDQREVDDFLDEVVAALRHYEQGGRPEGIPRGDAPGGTSATVRSATAGGTSSDPATGTLGKRAARWLRGDPGPRG